MASALLQLNPENRIGADEGLQHPYFAQLPKKLYELPDGEQFILKYFYVYVNFECVCIDRNINIYCGRYLLIS